MAQIHFSDDPLRDNPANLPAPEAVLSLLRIGAGGPLALTRYQILKYLRLAHPSGSIYRRSNELSPERLAKRLRSKAAKGIQELLARDEIRVLKLPVAYEPLGFKCVFWFEHTEIPDCFSRLCSAWEAIRAKEAPREIVTLSENVPAIESLVAEGGSQALAAELILADTQIVAAGCCTPLHNFGRIRFWDRRSRWIGGATMGQESYLAISFSEFAECADVCATCVPTAGSWPQTYDALRQLLEECRCNGSYLNIYIPGDFPTGKTYLL